MIIDINDSVTIREIQKKFSSKYPYLEIQFFIHYPGKDNLLSKKELAPVDKTIGEIKKTHVSGLLEIRSSNTITDVESEFLSRFGLSVQILRKSNAHWILPDRADQLTLKEQNEIGGKAADHIVHPEYDSGIDDGEY